MPNGTLPPAFQMAPYEGNAYYVRGMLQAKMSDTTASPGKPQTSLSH